MDELLEKLDATRGFELEGDTELVAIPVLCRRHALLDAVALALDAEGDALPSALPRLDLDHPGSHVGQEHRAEGHRDDLPEVQNRDVAQRLLHVPSMAAKARAAPAIVRRAGGRVNRPVSRNCRMPASNRAGDSIESCTAGHFPWSRHGPEAEALRGHGGAIPRGPYRSLQFRGLQSGPGALHGSLCRGPGPGDPRLRGCGVHQ